jgi:serine/threonine protein kinase
MGLQMLVPVRCPTAGCGAAYQVPRERVGHAGRCKKCGAFFTLLAAETAPLADAAAGAGDDPMPPGGPIPHPLTGTEPSAHVIDRGQELAETFGRFRIVRRLGKGGMGTVYLAFDTLMNRKVALKIPRFGPKNREVMLERFRREAMAAAGFDHPNLCRVDKFDQIDGTHYLTMPYLEGRTLADCLEGTSKLPQKPVVALVRVLAMAMAEAHARGVVHRDLKPSNVMIVKDRGPVIVDFGLSLRAGYRESGLAEPATVVSDDVRVTSAGSVIGTIGYMAPEQVSGDLAAMGEGCDIYSLGVILYELLTDRLPFDGPPAVVMGLILACVPDPPSAHRQDLHPRLDAICRKAMAKRPDERYASMLELAGALGRHLRNEELTELLAPAVTVENLGSQAAQRLVAQFLGEASESAEHLEPAASAGQPLSSWARRFGTVRSFARRAGVKYAGVVALIVAVTLAGSFLGKRAASGRQGAAPRFAISSPESTSPVKPSGERPPKDGGVPTRSPDKSFHFVPGAPISWPGAHVTSVAFTPDSKKLLVASDVPPYLQLYDLTRADTPMIRRFMGHTSWVNQIAFSEDGRRVLSGGNDATMRFWDVETGRELRPAIEGFPSAVERVALAPDGNQAAASAGNLLFYWDLGRGSDSRFAESHKGVMTSVTFSPDGRKILTTSGDQTARLWDAATLREERAFEGHRTRVTCAALSPDGRRILTLAKDQIRLWETDTARIIWIADLPRGDRPADPNSSDWVAFAPDGRMALTTQHVEAIVTLWDTDTGHSLTVNELSRRLNKAVIAPDGRQIACGSYRGFVERLRLEPGKEPGREPVARPRVVPVYARSQSGKSPEPAGPPASKKAGAEIQRPTPGPTAPEGRADRTDSEANATNPAVRKDALQPTLKEIRAGGFSRPARSSTAVTYLRVSSQAGDPIGQGRSYSYGASFLTAGASRGAVHVNVGSAGDWRLSLEAPWNRPLEVGVYLGARNGASRTGPGMEFSGRGRTTSQIQGRFVVWEFEREGSQVKSLAVDFFQSCNGMPPLSGKLRYHSTFK